MLKIKNDSEKKKSYGTNSQVKLVSFLFLVTCASTMTLEFSEATDFAVANLEGVITNAQFSFSDNWELDVVQKPMENELHVELVNIPGESFLLVKTSKNVGDSIDENDLFYYVDSEAGFQVMSVWVNLDPTPDMNKLQTKVIFKFLETEDGKTGSIINSHILGFIKENYSALTTLGEGPETKGMTLNRVPMLQPKVKGKELIYDEKILKSSSTIWDQLKEHLCHKLPIDKLINIEEMGLKVKDNLDKAIEEFKTTIKDEIDGKLKNGFLRHVKHEDRDEFKKLYETGYNAVVEGLKNKELSDGEKIRNEVENTLKKVVKNILEKINCYIFNDNQTDWNVLVSTMVYLVDPVNPNFTEYNTLDKFCHKTIEFYIMYVQEELKDRKYKLLENQINTWASQGNNAVEGALTGDYWKDKDLEYTEKLKSIINSVIEFDLNLYLSYGLVWPMIAPIIKNYAIEIMVAYFFLLEKENKDFFTKAFDIDLFVYMARFKRALTLFDTKSTQEINAIYEKDDGLLI
jgi:hypothetical protein